MATWSFRNCCKDAVGWVFMVSVVIAFTLLVIMNAISPNRFASVEENRFIDAILDSRCICVCPHNLNTTNRHNRTVFMKEVSDPSKCVCVEIVFDADELVCLQCECSFESRNALLIAFIVSSTLVVAFCCMPPCAFVVCIQPWVKVKALRTYAGPSLHQQSYSHHYQQTHHSSSHITRIRRSSQNRMNETPT